MLHGIWAMPSWFVGVCGALLVGAGFLARWAVRLAREDDWDEPDWQRDPNWTATCDWGFCDADSVSMRWDDDGKRWLSVCASHDLPGQGVPAPLAGEHHPTADEWEQLDADQAADLLIAEWHDEPPADWPASPDVWDAWWADMDGLERECLKVTRLRQREAQLWGELKAETRELCGVAA